MATPRMTATALVAVALTLIVTACGSSGNPADGPRPDNAEGNDQRTGGESSEEYVTPSGEDGVAVEQDQPAPPPTPGSDAGSEETDEVRGGSDSRKTVRRHGTELQVSVYDLVRGDATVELVFRVHNSGDAESPRFHELLGADEDVQELAAVELVDTANGRVHRVARDEAGHCVCSRPDPSLILWPSDTVELSATFAAPPEDVETMDVRVPLVGTFTEVPVVRG